MNHDSKPLDPCYLVHRAGHVNDDCVDADSEETVYLPRGTGFIAKLLSFLPGGRKKYVVPKGRLSSPIALHGAALNVTIDETGEDIILLPKLSIVAVVSSDESCERLARALESSYEDQLDKVRKVVGGVFADKVGLSCESERLDQLADLDSALSKELDEDVRKRLGLKVKWLLKPDPETETWIRSLQAELSKATPQVFNEESRTCQFRLTYSSRILSVRPSRFHVVSRRARAGVAPTGEKDKILEIIFNALNPGFGVFGGGRQISDHPALWPLIEAAFDQVAAPRIAEEFGYKMQFTDFRRERTEAELDALKQLESSERMLRAYDAADRDLISSQDHLLELREQERLAIREDDLDADSDRLKRIRANIKAGEKEVKAADKRRSKAQVDMESSSQSPTTTLSTEDDGRARHFLQQFSDLLRLEVQDLPKMLGENSTTEKSGQSGEQETSEE